MDKVSRAPAAMNNLPLDWEEVHISDVTIRTKQRDPRRQPTMRFRYVDVSSVSNSSFRIVEASEIEGSAAPSRARKEICAGDVLFATVRPTLKRVALVPPELHGQIASTGFIVLRADPEKLNPRYLYSRLLTDAFIKRMGELERGASYPAVRDTDILNEVVPVPPLPEQRKIAAVLGVVQRAMEQQERLLVLTAELKKALMHQLFTQGLRGEPQKQTDIGPVPESWEVVLFEQFALLQRGFDLPRSEFRDGHYPVVGATTTIGFHDKWNVKGPGVTVVRSGSSAGKPQFIAADFWAHNVVLFVKDFHGHNPQFVYYKIQNLDLTKYREGVAVPTLNRNSFRTIPIAVPQREEQDKFVQVLDSVEQKEELHRRKHATLSALFRTLLHQLMTAQLRVHNLDLPELETGDKGIKV
ncbi:restriction endonuclease subunit S [Candidatus Methylomirabilis sp.]|uniref:restriction endonuclease subunit S n=1 Tax=Candidatus Methylomirabilis sp. TaxID=2032687 RepID=UPI003075F516